MLCEMPKTHQASTSGETASQARSLYTSEVPFKKKGHYSDFYKNRGACEPMSRAPPGPKRDPVPPGAPELRLRQRPGKYSCAWNGRRQHWAQFLETLVIRRAQLQDPQA